MASLGSVDEKSQESAELEDDDPLLEHFEEGHVGVEEVEEVRFVA